MPSSTHDTGSSPMGPEFDEKGNRIKKVENNGGSSAPEDGASETGPLSREQREAIIREKTELITEMFKGLKQGDTFPIFRGGIEGGSELASILARRGDKIVVWESLAGKHIIDADHMVDRYPLESSLRALTERVADDQFELIQREGDGIKDFVPFYNEAVARWEKGEATDDEAESDPKGTKYYADHPDTDNA